MRDYDKHLEAQYGPDLDGEDDQPDDNPPTITVSGNHITITRLDSEGNPVGPPVEVSDMVHDLSFDLPEAVEVFDWDMTTDKTLTLDIEFCKVDPALIRLMTGTPPYGDIPTEVWSRPWWYRWLPRFLKHRVKGRWILLAYGGKPEPYKHPRLAFAAHCLRRWTLDLVVDGARFVKRWKWTITGILSLIVLAAAGAWWVRFLYRVVTR